MKRILCLKRTKDLKDNQTLAIYCLIRDIKKARKRYRSRAFSLISPQVGYGKPGKERSTWGEMYFFNAEWLVL